MVVEAAMGILDGATDGTGSAGDLAQSLNLPVIMIVDASKTGQSAALPLLGLQVARPDVKLAGVILNKVGILISTLLFHFDFTSDVTYFSLHYDLGRSIFSDVLHTCLLLWENN